MNFTTKPRDTLWYPIIDSPAAFAIAVQEAEIIRLRKAGQLGEAFEREQEVQAMRREAVKDALQANAPAFCFAFVPLKQRRAVIAQHTQREFFPHPNAQDEKGFIREENTDYAAVIMALSLRSCVGWRNITQPGALEPIPFSVEQLKAWLENEVEIFNWFTNNLMAIFAEFDDLLAQQQALDLKN